MISGAIASRGPGEARSRHTHTSIARQNRTMTAVRTLSPMPHRCSTPRRWLPLWLAFASLSAGLTLPAETRAASAIAMHGVPALPEGFAHFPYADPDAPQGRPSAALPARHVRQPQPLQPQGRLHRAGAEHHGVRDPDGALAGRALHALRARSPAAWTPTTPAVSRPSTSIPRARFSDGTPITARRRALHLRPSSRPRVARSSAQAFGAVKGVTAPDPQTIRFDLAGLGDRELPLPSA